MFRLALHWKILIAMALGVLWSLLAMQFGLHRFTADYISPFGTIFINALKFIAIPLVLFSVVTGVAGLGNPSKLGRMGVKTLSLYLLTTLVSVSLGLTLVNIFKPGVQNDAKLKAENRAFYELWAAENNVPLADQKRVFTNLPASEQDRIQQKFASNKEQDDYQQFNEKNDLAQQTKKQGPLQPLVDMVPENLVLSFTNPSFMLQVIFFAVFFGVALSLLPTEKVHVVHGFFNGMNEVFVKMVHIIMLAAPFFVFCLMAGVLTKTADSISELMGIFFLLGKYALVVLMGIFLLIFGFYPLLLRLFRTAIPYGAFFRAMSPAQFLAFSTSSSAATLPVTITCVEENLKVPKAVSDFVLPIGATVNMDGTSLYQAVAVVFLAQFHDIDLTLYQQFAILATATLASIGAAAIPSAGLIMLMIVLSSVGLNPLWVIIIFPIDRLLDMCRTVANVTSDATVSVIIAKSEGLK